MQSATTGDHQSNKKKKSSSKLQSYKYNERYVNEMDLTIGTLTLPQ